MRETPPKVITIPAKPETAKTQETKRQLRVAAYCRVSTDEEEQLTSYEAQQNYYTDYIMKNRDWTMAGIFADEGITGTSARKRPEFLRMIRLCKKKKIDIVLTKSISRFARNTVVLLETIRELKLLGIDVYFEKENLHSMSKEGELLLTLLGTYAEEEARSASENQNWRIQKLHRQGKTTSGKILGYKLVNGRYVIKPEEAKVVKQIFDYYLSGMGFIAIANQLNQDGVTTRGGHSWTENEVQTILTNEKYMGDMLLQKT